jgi:hypothetical protein
MFRGKSAQIPGHVIPSSGDAHDEAHSAVSR